MTGDDALTARNISRGLRTHHLGRSLDVRTTVGSTNDVALDALGGPGAGAPHGHLVVADTQTAGRGQRGRPWVSPPGVGIYASVVLRSDRPLAAPTALVAAAGLGIAEGIEAAADVRVGIKWPNDLWIDGQKVAGILVEARGYRPDEPAVVAGFGIDVNQSVADFPPELLAVATSLRIATGHRHDRAAVLRAVLVALESRIDEVFARGATPALHDAYRARSVLLGRRVGLIDGEEPLVGTVADLSATDGLLLRTDDGAHRHVKAEHARDVRPV